MAADTWTPEHRAAADALKKLERQANAIMTLIQFVGDADTVPEDAISGACSAVRDLLKRMEQILLWEAR